MTTKSNLRKVLLQQRAAINPIDLRARNDRILERLRRIIDQARPDLIALYSPFRNEVDVTPLIEEMPFRKFALPVVIDKKQMDFYPVDSQTTLQENLWGIPEPVPSGAPIALNSTSLIIIPCVAIDARGTRLGYGGGYYDRYLARFPNCLKVGVVLAEFLISSIPSHDHDQRLDVIVTDADACAVDHSS